MPPSVSPSFFAASTSATIRRGGGIEAAQRIGVERGDVVRSRKGRPCRHLNGADRQRVADEADAELTEERAGDRAQSDARRRLASTRAFEDRTRLVEAVLLHADQVGVARAGRVSAAPRPRDISVISTGSALMTSVHLGHSVLPMRSAIGLPMLRPCRTPAEIVSSSSSNFIREPRP
jgi:hypothetical protein